jgi:hypothetical protein
MERALDKLAAHSGDYFGIDIAALKGKVNELLAAGQPEFFKIESK